MTNQEDWRKLSINENKFMHAWKQIYKDTKGYFNEYGIPDYH